MLIDDHVSLSLQDNDSITNQDLVSVGPPVERAESTYSDGTDLAPFSIRRFLNDKDEPDGIEDPPNVYEELPPQGEGMEEEERDCLQGSSDHVVLIETESDSTGSLEDRHKMMLSNIQKENQAYQASKGKEEAVELSPLTTPSTLISTPSSISNPLPNGHRPAPDGYVVEHAKSEGFHNLSCTQPGLGNMSTGLTPPLAEINSNHNQAHHVITSHVTALNVSQIQQHQQLQQPLTAARTVGVASSGDGHLQTPLMGGCVTNAVPTPSPGDRNSSLTMVVGDERSTLGATSSSGGYVQAPFLGGFVPDMQETLQQPLLGDSSLTELSLSDEKTMLHLQSQSPLVTHTPSADGYVHGVSTGVERRGRGASAESGNEDDSTSNEGDSSSVFDDDVPSSDLGVHSIRPRSTVTSGFQSGSSESTSPEPPNKSTSSSVSAVPHSPTSVSTLPLTNTQVRPPSGKGDCSTSILNTSLLQTSSSSNPASNSLPHPHTHSSSNSSQVQTTDFVSAYRPSSTGSSSGYMTNTRSQSYYSSSANSQTTKCTSDELDQELEGDEEDPSSKYTVPSLLGSSKSASPAIPRATVSDWTAKDVPPPQLPVQHAFYNTHHHLAAAASHPVTDYVNTKDVDLNNIATTLGQLSQTSERVTDHQEVSFEFPTCSS